MKRFLNDLLREYVDAPPMLPLLSGEIDSISSSVVEITVSEDGEVTVSPVEDTPEHIAEFAYVVSFRRMNKMLAQHQLVDSLNALEKERWQALVARFQEIHAVDADARPRARA